MAKKFKVGDIVELTIGGPKMLIDYYVKSASNRHYGFRDQCKWHDKNNKPCTDSYDEILLTKHEDEEE